MMIDSGCHDSIINPVVWKSLGKPELTSVAEERLSGTKTKVPLLGQFQTQVELCGKKFANLPLQVAESESTPNLIGRAWIANMNVDWNDVFRVRKVPKRTRCRFLKTTPEQAKAAASALIRSTDHLYEEIVIENKPATMIIDTGSTVSTIGFDEWSRLGRPKINKNGNFKIRDTAGSVLRMVGECLVKVMFHGPQPVSFFLPVWVAPIPFAGIIGTNWLEELELDFNHLFTTIG